MFFFNIYYNIQVYSVQRVATGLTVRDSNPVEKAVTKYKSTLPNIKEEQ
jgi:hypothetical protein